MPHEGSDPGVSRRGGRRKGSGKRADASAPWPLRAVQALADGSRWSIIQYLSTNEAAIGQVARELGLSVACTSKHMSILKESELVQTARRGREVVCRLAIAGTRAGDLLGAVGGADYAPTRGMQDVYADLARRVDAQITKWGALAASDIPAFNKAVRASSLTAVGTRMARPARGAARAGRRPAPAARRSNRRR